jgi:hypothetical protein
MHTIKKYEPAMNKIMRMNSVTSTIENGFVHLPDKAAWLPDFLHELAGFPRGKYDDQVDSMSQALDWFKHQCMTEGYGLLEFYKQEKEKMKLEQGTATIPPSRPCQCGGVMSQIIPGGLRCAQCGTQWAPPGAQPRKLYLNRKDVLNGVLFR